MDKRLKCTGRTRNCIHRACRKIGADVWTFNCLDLVLSCGMYEVDEVELYGDYRWMTLLPGPVVALHAGHLYLFKGPDMLIIDATNQGERFCAASNFLKEIM